MFSQGEDYLSLELELFLTECLLLELRLNKKTLIFICTAHCGEFVHSSFETETHKIRSRDLHHWLVPNPCFCLHVCYMTSQIHCVLWLLINVHHMIPSHANNPPTRYSLHHRFRWSHFSPLFTTDSDDPQAAVCGRSPRHSNRVGPATRIPPGHDLQQIRF